MKVSRAFKVAVKLHPDKRAYELAWAAGVHPNTLSKLLNGIEQPRNNDPRILAVGRVIGLPAEQCFEEKSELLDE